MSSNKANTSSIPVEKKAALEVKTEKPVDQNKPPPRKRTKTGCRTCRKRYILIIKNQPFFFSSYSNTNTAFEFLVFTMLTSTLDELNAMKANRIVRIVLRLIENAKVINNA